MRTAVLTDLENLSSSFWCQNESWVFIEKSGHFMDVAVAEDGTTASSWTLLKIWPPQSEETKQNKTFSLAQRY